MEKYPLASRPFGARSFVALVLLICSVSLGVLSVTGAPQHAPLPPQKIGPASNSGPGWAVVSSPNTNDGPEFNDFNAVACNSNIDCWAVGHRNASNGTIQLIEHWDGNSWSIVSSPNTKSNQANFLYGNFCNSASDCWAVGSNGQTLIEHWDGTSWVIVGSPNANASTNSLEAVTCSSSSNCWAVGYYNNGSMDHALIEKWDGSSWQVVPAPDTISPTYNYLHGISCSSGAQCWAVGDDYGTSGVYQTLTEQWDGNSWTIVTSPNAGASDNSLQSVTCSSGSDCWAVGTYINDRYQTLIEHWNGVTWTVTPSPNVSTNTALDNSLYGVTCVSSSGCWAVGKVSYSETLVQKWDGSTWSIVAAPDAGALFSVACTLTTDCWAVGNGNFVGSDQTLTEHWNGAAWSTVSSPNVNDGIRENQLSGITCLSVSDCWAVGFHDHQGLNGHGDQNLAEHWDGTSWSVVDAPNVTPTSINYLQGIACTSSSDCWAVGYSSGQGAQPLIEHWNGVMWSISSSPAPPAAAYAKLVGVSCNSASDCWAGGYYYNNNFSAERTLIEHFNGNSWSIVASPNGNNGFGQSNDLYALTCNSSSDCWAVGAVSPTSAAKTLIEHWDGSSWSIVASPNSSSSQPNVLNSVTCASASDCWAVGDFIANAVQTLTEHWNGTAWQIVASPNAGSPSSGQLTAVGCKSSSDCWAAALYIPATGGTQTFIQHWDGNSWQISSLYAEPPPKRLLYGITCIPTSQCWAVGNYFRSDLQTLIETYSATIPPLLTVGSRMTHGSSGTFDLNLPLTGTPAIECRRGGANGNFSIVFNFANDVSNCGTAATAGGTVAAGPNANQCTLNLTGVPNGQTLNVELDNVSDAFSNTGNVSIPVGFLVGDTNKDGFVDAVDAAQTKSQSGNAVGQSNYREDVNADGFIDAVDVALVKSKSGTVLSSSSSVAKPVSSSPKSKPRQPSRNQ